VAATESEQQLQTTTLSYTRRVIMQLEVPGLHIEQVLKRARAEVMRDTHNEQVPWEGSSLVHDFVINAGVAA